MASWDDTDFDVDTSEQTGAGVTDKWDGEDEDDDIADSWDALDEDDDKEKPKTTAQPRKKKPFAERIKEKEEKRRLEKLAKEEERKREEEENRELSPEEQIAEKLRQQRLQEESDLELAKEAFGITDMPGVKTIDKFVPNDREEFNELSQMIVTKFQDLESKSEYPGFLETLFRDCCASVDADSIKKIASALTVLATEKQKLSKPKAGKKKGAKQSNTLKAGKASTKSDMSGFNDDFYDEYEDFM